MNSSLAVAASSIARRTGFTGKPNPADAVSADVEGTGRSLTLDAPNPPSTWIEIPGVAACAPPTRCSTPVARTLAQTRIEPSRLTEPPPPVGRIDRFQPQT